MNKKFALAGVALLSTVILAACGNGGSNASGGSSSESASGATVEFVKEVTHDGEVIKGGQLNYAVVSAANSTGLLMDELTSTNVDSTFGGFVDEVIFGVDGDRMIDDSGLATADFDLKNKTVTVKLTGKDYKWSDGEPFTIDDYIFAIESIADPGYTGVRFGEDYLNIEGMKEFNEGKADSISGVEKIDDYTVVLKMKKMTPSLMYGGGAVPMYVTPKHIFKDIPVADWESSDYARTKKIVGMGAWKIKEIIPGESITYVPNEHYYKGAPKLDGLKVDIVSPDTIVSEMKAGNYDIAEMPNDQLEAYVNLDNITLLGRTRNSYEYISFNLGKYDEKTGKNVMDEKAKMNDPKLRQAISYAIDRKAAGDSLYNGLYQPADSLIISFYEDLHDDSLDFSYNPDKANKLLDDAGYKDVDGDGIREGKDGKPFTISFAARTRTDANEALVQQYIAWWKEVGLNVELYTGRTMELNAFYDEVEANNKDIDMFAGGWSTGYDPNPTGLYGENELYNMSRFVSEENTKLLNNIMSEENFDEEKNIKNYKAWQQYAFEQAFTIPTFEETVLTAVNKRVKYADTYFGSASKSPLYKLYKVELTAEKGIANK